MPPSVCDGAEKQRTPFGFLMLWTGALLSRLTCRRVPDIITNKNVVSQILQVINKAGQMEECSKGQPGIHYTLVRPVQHSKTRHFFRIHKKLGTTEGNFQRQLSVKAVSAPPGTQNNTSRSSDVPKRVASSQLHRK